MWVVSLLSLWYSAHDQSYKVTTSLACNLAPCDDDKCIISSCVLCMCVCAHACIHFKQHKEDQGVAQDHTIVTSHHVAHLVKISILLIGYSMSHGQVDQCITWDWGKAVGDGRLKGVCSMQVNDYSKIKLDASNWYCLLVPCMEQLKVFYCTFYVQHTHSEDYYDTDKQY